jgi:hypothetical protein
MIHGAPLRAFGGAGLFALLAEPLGLVLAATVGLLVAAGPVSPAAGALQAGILALLAWVVFVAWLGIDLPLRPAL